MDEGISALCGEDLPLLLVVTHIGVHTKGQERDDDVQVIIWSGVCEYLCQQAVCKEEWGNIRHCLSSPRSAHTLFCLVLLPLWDILITSQDHHFEVTAFPHQSTSRSPDTQTRIFLPGKSQKNSQGSSDLLCDGIPDRSKFGFYGVSLTLAVLHSGPWGVGARFRHGPSAPEHQHLLQ